MKGCCAHPKEKKTRLKIAIPQQHIVGKTRDSFVFQALCVLWVIIITSAALRILKIFQILTRFSHLACVSSWKTDRFVCAIIARFFSSNTLKQQALMIFNSIFIFPWMNVTTDISICIIRPHSKFEPPQVIPLISVISVFSYIFWERERERWVRVNRGINLEIWRYSLNIIIYQIYQRDFMTIYKLTSVCALTSRKYLKVALKAS